ncbi:MAG: methyltransferase domain-containing protein [Deltaproteobacteria bacterium]|nr:MAG: methyltransferase domain-containing protein [Deltaproteobacteria bacterium]
MVRLNPEEYDRTWWQRVFDEIYLITDARSVCCPETTSAEIDMILEVIRLNPQDRILDLCGGQGRHAIELNRRGHRNVTVVDYSEVLLRVGIRDARRMGCEIDFCRADACEVGLAAGIFDVILVMGNSFGYFAEDRDNQRILLEICRLLKPGGNLLLDLIDSDYARQQFKTSSWHEADEDVVVCRQRNLRDDGIVVREMVLSKQRGLVRDINYFARLFRRRELETLLADSGFQRISFEGTLISHPTAKDYGLLTRRMLVTARKPS